LIIKADNGPRFGLSGSGLCRTLTALIGKYYSKSINHNADAC